MLGGKGKPWQPGEKLKLLFAGYNGTRNMGSDVRVEEMLRQIRHILGADRVDFSVMSQNFEFSKGYFDGTTQVHLPDIFPPFLFERSAEASWRGRLRRLHVQEQVRQCPDDHDDRLAWASRRSRTSSQSAMEPKPATWTRWWRKCAAAIARIHWLSRAMRNLAPCCANLAVPTELGTDTAWTFEPKSARVWAERFEASRMGRRAPVLVVCPDQSFRMAGEGVGCEMRSAQP